MRSSPGREIEPAHMAMGTVEPAGNAIISPNHRIACCFNASDRIICCFNAVDRIICSFDVTSRAADRIVCWFNERGPIPALHGARPIAGTLNSDE